MNQVSNKIRELIEYLNYHTKCYDEGKPEISDMEWDIKYYELDKLEKENNGGLAFCSGGSYMLPVYDLPAQVLEKLKNESIEKKSISYLNKNPIAELLVKTHEVDVHGLHNQQNTLENSGDTPYMAFVTDEMTEKIATISEYLVLGEVYTTLKKSDVENFQTKDGVVPLDSMLELCTGLKEYIDKNGFDLNDKKCVKEVAKIGAEYWNKCKSEVYIKQGQSAISDTRDASLIGMIKCAREWDKRKELMLKGININGKEVNIPKECLDFIEPSKEKINRVVGDKYITNEDLLKIDKHLNSLGFKNDEEKANYLAEQAIMITDRNPEADLKLRDLLLACQNNEKQCNTIVYSDGIKDTYNSDGNVNVSKNGVSYTMQISNKEEKTEEKVIKKSPKEELVENLAKIHPKVENVKDNTKQSIDMVQIMQKSNQGR